MNRKNLSYPVLFILVAIAFLLSSCKKDKITPTSAEVVATEIQSVILKNNLKRVYPVRYMEVFPGSFPVNGGTVWSFSNGFIHINYNSIIRDWNLDALVAYSISNVIMDDDTTAKALILYMR